MKSANPDTKKEDDIKMEKIQSAAIRYRLAGYTEYKYMTGYSHGDCINMFSCMDIPARLRDMDTEEQGFMTTTGRFVDRVEALRIAVAANQLKSPETYNYDILYSEFIDWRK